MPGAKDLTGQRFGRLTVSHRAENSRHGKARWLCECSCGNMKTVLAATLLRGESRSCGCLNAEVSRAVHTKHGKRNTRTYSIWRAMITRCHNPNTAAFRAYGAKGIQVCTRWRKFENFLADMGECPQGLTIDRINGKCGYEPGNCRWATYQEQSDNSRTPNFLTLNGKTMNIRQWAMHIGINESTLRERLSKWPQEEALSTPKTHKYTRAKHKLSSQ